MKLPCLLLSFIAVILGAITSSAQAPPNDSFADRTDLGSAEPVEVTVDASEATVGEGGEPPFFDLSAPGSVWWKWEAPQAGYYLFSSSGTPHPDAPFFEPSTNLILYQDNSSFVTLENGGDPFGNMESKTSLIYYFERGERAAIQASGQFTSVGNITLQINTPEPPEIFDVIPDMTRVDISGGESVGTALDFSVFSPGGIYEIDLSLVDARGRVVHSSVFSTSPLNGSDGIERTAGTAEEGIYRATIDIPPFHSGGAWRYRFVVTDELGIKSYYGWTEPNIRQPGVSFAFTGEFDGTLEVVNDGQIDSERPQITAINYSPTTVNVANDEQEVTITVGASDDTGISQISGIFYTESGGFFRSMGAFSTAPVTGDNQNGTYQSEITIPAGIDGRLVFPRIFIRDLGGNQITYGTTTNPFPGGFDGAFEIVNDGVEDLPPVLRSITVTPATVDISTGDQEVTVRVEALDDLSEVELASFSAGMPGGFFGGVLGSSNRISSGVFEKTFCVKQFSNPGDYTVRVTVQDETDRSARYGGTDLPLPDGSTSIITVVNNGNVDMSAPEITRLKLLPTTVDVSESSQEVVIQLDASDDIGVSTLLVSLFDSESSSDPFLFDVEMSQVSGDSLAGSYEGRFNVPAGTGAGQWILSASVFDDFGRSNIYGGLQGATLPEGFEGALTIVNEPQNLPPVLTSLTLTPSMVDITGSSQTVEVRIEATDDFSEICYVAINIDLPVDDLNAAFFADAAPLPLEGQLIESSTGVFEGIIRVPQFLEPGDYPIRVDLSTSDISSPDYLEPATYSFYSSSGGNSFPDGSPNFLSVVNTGEIDLTAPVLNRVTISPNVVDVTGGDQEITVQVEASDDVGLDSITFFVSSETGISLIGSVSMIQSLISGDSKAGIYERTITIPANIAPDTFFVGLHLGDVLGRVSSYGQADPDSPLPEGSDYELTVENTGEVDAAPPELYALEFTPNPVSRDRLPVSVMATVGVSDSIVGFESGIVQLFRGVDDFSAPPGFVGFGAEDLTVGDSLFGVYQFEIELGELPPSSQLFASLLLRDGINQQSGYRETTQQGIDLPAEFEPLMIIDSYNDAYDAWVEAHTDIPANLTSPAADADGDGFANGTEFFLGMEPMLDSNGTPQVPEIVMKNGQFGLRVPVAEENLQMAGRTVNATPKAQWSRDGQSWRDIPAPEIVDGAMTFLTPVDAGGIKLMRFVVEFAPPVPMN